MNNSYNNNNSIYDNDNNSSIEEDFHNKHNDLLDSIPTDKLRPKPPKKGILKSPPPPASKFPFIPPFGDFFDILSGNKSDQQPQSQLQSHSQPQIRSITQQNSINNEDSAKSLPQKLQQQINQPVSNSNNNISQSPNNSPPTPKLSPPIKRVAFHVPNMTVTYPILSTLPPVSSKEKRDQVENAYREQLKLKSGNEGKNYWINDDGRSLIDLYEQCCFVREEVPKIEVAEQLKLSTQMKANNRTLDLSGFRLTKDEIEPISDVLSVDFGLQKLILEEMNLGDDSVKPILHALLISGTLPWLSLANNKNIKEKGWKYVSIFLKRAHNLTYIDLSENVIDKKSMEKIMNSLAVDINVEMDQQQQQQQQLSSESASSNNDNDNKEDDNEELYTQMTSLIPSPTLLQDKSNHKSNLSTIRLENCSFKSGSLDAIAHNLRNSSIKHLSLRSNRISSNGVVALALMLKDYNEVQHKSLSSDPFSKSSSINQSRQPYATNENDKPSKGIFSLFNSNSRSDLDAVDKESTPIISTSPSRHLTSSPTPISNETNVSSQKSSDNHNEDEKILNQKLNFDIVHGLITLDLKGNEIKSSVNYIATALKRNQTLKVLNLSENKIDSTGLLSIAEALKYNTTLETLDLSRNPCCGSQLEGITTLRTSFTINSNLKRLFLSNTEMKSEGAIALAEFLPESKSLFHLDLTENDLDISGVMALSVSVRMNESVRCLDINIPINDSEMARLSQEIFQSCLRNTEYAQSKSTGKMKNLFGPIERSALAKTLHEAEIQQSAAETVAAAESPEGKVRARIWSQSPDDVLEASSAITESLEDLFKKPITDSVRKSIDALIIDSKALKDRLIELIGEGLLDNEEKLSSGLEINDRLANVIKLINALPAKVKKTKLPSASISSNSSINNRSRSSSLSSQSSKVTNNNGRLRSSSLHEDEMFSPHFQILDSDDSDLEVDESMNSTSDENDNDNDKNTINLKPKLSIKTSVDKVDDEATPKPTKPNEFTDESNKLKSPTSDLSRSQLFEEGEIFRKGVALLNNERIESEEDGEKLKKEILETELPISKTSSP